MEIISHFKDNLGIEQTKMSKDLFGVERILPKSKITNKRQFILKMFVDEINKERVGTSFKPIFPRVVALKTSHLKIYDLEYFYSQCKDYQKRCGSFSKCFFGSLKLDVKNEKPKEITKQVL